MDRTPPPKHPSHAQSQIASVGEWLDYFLEISGVLRSKLISPSRSRYLTLPRAFLTYHGRQLGFTLAELADWLERHPSSLLEAVERSRALHPNLFTSVVTRWIRTKQTTKLRQLLADRALRHPPVSK